jgi:hypothetical protein
MSRHLLDLRLFASSSYQPSCANRHSTWPEGVVHYVYLGRGLHSRTQLRDIFILTYNVVRLGAVAAGGAGALPVLSGDVLRVPGAPRGAALRRHAPHAPHPSGGAAGGKHEHDTHRSI